MSPNQWHLRYSSRELLTVHKYVHLTVWSVFRRSARNAVKVYRLRFAVHAASKSHPGVLKYCASQKKFIFNVLFSTVLKSLYVHVSNVYYICIHALCIQMVQSIICVLYCRQREIKAVKAQVYLRFSILRCQLIYCFWSLSILAELSSSLSALSGVS